MDKPVDMQEGDNINGGTTDPMERSSINQLPMAKNIKKSIEDKERKDKIEAHKTKKTNKTIDDNERKDKIKAHKTNKTIDDKQRKDKIEAHKSEKTIDDKQRKDKIEAHKSEKTIDDKQRKDKIKAHKTEKTIDDKQRKDKIEAHKTEKTMDGEEHKNKIEAHKTEKTDDTMDYNLPDTLSPGSPWERDTAEDKKRWKEISKELQGKPLGPTPRLWDNDIGDKEKPEMPDSQETLRLDDFAQEGTTNTQEPIPPKAPAVKGRAKSKACAKAKAKRNASAKAKLLRRKQTPEEKKRVHRIASDRWHEKWLSKGVPRSEASNGSSKTEGKVKKSEKQVDKTKNDAASKASKAEIKDQEVQDTEMSKGTKRRKDSSTSAPPQPAAKKTKNSETGESTIPKETLSFRHTYIYLILYDGKCYTFCDPMSSSRMIQNQLSGCCMMSGYISPI